MKRLYFLVLVLFISILPFKVMQVQAESKFLKDENNSLKVTEMKYSSKKIPTQFNGYRIVQLSDLHGKLFGEEQKVLLKKVKLLKPDVIVFTGDLIDKRNYNAKPGLILMREINKIAPVYYVTGNHEWQSDRFISLQKKLTNLGVHVLRNCYKEIQIGNGSIYMIGIDAPTKKVDEDKLVREELKEILYNLNKQDGFKILLSHRPDLFPIYSEFNIDLIFSGHAHGGQIRLPYIGGIIAPDQGILPKYSSGKYINRNSTMIVNRGLGNSLFPQRLFNNPEIIVLKLSHRDQ